MSPRPLGDKQSRDQQSSDQPFKNKVIWLSGGTSGIGLSLLHLLLEQAARVIVTGRNIQTLEKLQGKYPDQLVLIKLDLNQPQEIDLFAKRLQQHTDYLDMLILNAGVCEYIDINTMDMGAVRRVMEVNYFGAFACCELALPFLRKAAHKALIVGISSLSTFAPFTRAQAYGASKSAFAYLLESLRIDLHPDVDVTVISPGFVETPLTEKNNFPMPFIISSDEAAKKIIKAIKKRPLHYAFPKPFYFLLRISGLFPKLWFKLSVTKLKNIPSPKAE